MTLARNGSADAEHAGTRAVLRSSVAKLRESIATRARSMPLARHAWARYRRRKYERRIRRFVDEKSGRADRLPMGAVYEATMRCNLHCEFCYVGDLLNIEGEWREEMTLDALRKAFPDTPDFQVSLTGGEIFMRKDIMSVLDLFREKGYACGYLTTNGTIITPERAEALADLAAGGFLKHVSVSIDGPGAVHDEARGLKGTFERTCEGLRRLQAAARRKHAPLRVSINTTVAHQSLDALDQMVDVAEELGVDAIGLNHLMFSTPDEVAETVRLIGASDASTIATFVTDDPGLDVEVVRRKVAALEAKCKAKNVLFDFRPKVHPQLIDNYYTPGAKLEGRCLYPFLHARVSFSGKVYFCPFIRVEVGDLAESSLEEIWNGERYVDMRRRLIENKIFPVCRRCCKVELSPQPVAEPFGAGVPRPARRAIPLTVVR
jgi:MoaA/NifB/PqqE/SkfB family radical SAM enzyme